MVRAKSKNKKCRVCRTRLVRNRNWNKTNFEAKRRICKDCNTQQINEWRKKHPIKCQRNVIRATLAIYDLSLEEFEELKERQKNLCAICRERQIGKRRLAVDHKHGTGKIRGLLCNKCNAGLGQFRDSITLLRAAIRYLKKAPFVPARHFVAV